MSSSRKQQHVHLAVNSDVRFRNKTSGLDTVELPYNALPEIDLKDVDTSVTFLGKPLRLPFLITGMTGGYENAAEINAGLAEACAELGIAMGVGSMRQALDGNHLPSFTALKPYANNIPLIANIGAVQIVELHRNSSLIDSCNSLVDMIGAAALAVHLNPLQELLQPEGEPRFSGVKGALEELNAQLSVPVIVKEVGAGISGKVAAQLAKTGVKIIDVAGAGGTSWAGVEILRRDDNENLDQYWDVGISTADCLRQCRGIVPTLIASGGIEHGGDAARAIALGAAMAGSARPALQAFMHGGTAEVVSLFRMWEQDLRRWMFLTGSQTIENLAAVLQK